MGCAPLPVLKLPAEIAVLSGPCRPVPMIGSTPPPAYHGKLKTFAFVCLDALETAPIAIHGIAKAARDEAKPADVAADPDKKVAPFHRIPCADGHVETVQAWSRGEARGIAKKRGCTLARVGRETGQAKKAA